MDETIFPPSWRAEEIGVVNNQMVVLWTKSGIYVRTVASQYEGILQCSINVVGGEQDVIEVEIPGCHFTT